MAREITEEMIKIANKHCREDLRNALCEGYGGNLKLNEADEEVGIDSYEVVPNKTLNGNIYDISKHLRRPYTQISKEDYECLVDIAENENSDFFEKGGIYYTFGNADDVYALMSIDDLDAISKDEEGDKK